MTQDCQYSLKVLPMIVSTLFLSAAIILAFWDYARLTNRSLWTDNQVYATADNFFLNLVLPLSKLQLYDALQETAQEDANANTPWA